MRRGVGGRRYRVALAAVLAVAALPVGASAAPASRCPGVTTTSDGWRRAAPPVFPGKARVRSYAVAPRDPDLLFAASAHHLARSTDGGCTWSTVYRVPATTSLLPVTASTASIAAVATGGSHVYLLVRDLRAPFVVVSADRGTTWQTASVPVAGLWGGDSARLVTDLSGRHAYLFLDAEPTEPGATAWDVVHATEDGGATWTPRPVGSSLDTAAAAVRDIAVDPQTGTDLWATTSVGLLHSPDGGRTWDVSATSGRGDLGALSVTHRVREPVQVLVASTDEWLVYVRGNGGDLTTVNTPGPPTSLVGGRTELEAVITTEIGIYELDFRSLRWSSGDRPYLAGVTTDYTTAPRYHACECVGDGDGSIWSRLPRQFDVPRRPDADPDPPRVNDPGFFPGAEGCAPGRGSADAHETAPSAVLPAAGEITVAPGRSKTVDYRFRVRPRRLDLFFLLDTGNRAGRFGCAAQQGSVWAAAQLSRTRNVRAGLGEYRDYPRTGTRVNLLPVLGPRCDQQLRNAFVYRRALRVGPVGATFRQRVSRLTVGACETSHAALTGLLQAVTGAGRDLPPAGGSPYDVRPAQDAGFADDAYKVIVHVNGASFGTPERDVAYPGPEFAEVIDALNAEDVKQVGIYVAPPPKRHDEEVIDVDDSGDTDLVRIARGTGTLAQRAIDCGGSLTAGVLVGQPLVCAHLDDDEFAFPSRTEPPLGRQMVDLVTALADVRPMRLAVLSGAGATVSAVTPAAPRRLDHLLGHTLRYSVTFRCGADEAGDVKEVRLGGEVGSDVVATATATVRCGPPALVPPGRSAELVPAGVPLVAAPAAPVAPQVSTNANPSVTANTAPQPNVQPQNVAQGVAAGVAVPQEESQPRLAYADAGPPELADEYAMSSRPRSLPRDLPAWMVVQVALVTTCAAGALALQRARVAQALVRRRRF